MNDENGLNPYESPATDFPTAVVRPPTTNKGIGRLYFFLVWIVGGFVSGMVDEFVLLATGVDVAFFTTIILLAVLGIAMGSRYHNIGHGRNWGWAIIVPFLNLYCLAQCLYAPEGYAHSGKLDSAGWIIAIIIGAIVIAFIAMMAFMIYTLSTVGA